jgi:two-component system, OmpR family, sensor histidine kinase VicK
VEASSQAKGSSFLHSLADRSHQAIFSYQPAAKRIIYLNAACEQILGIAANNQAHPETLLERVHPDDRSFVVQAYEQLCQGNDQNEVEFRLQKVDGSFRWICLWGYYIQEAGQPLTLAGYAQDITFRKEHQQIERKFTAQKNSLLEILSHDLSGPIINIQALASYAGKLASQGNLEEMVQLISLIEKTARRNVHLIRTFVDQEALEYEQLSLSRERIDVVERIRYPIDQLRGSEENLQKTFELMSSHPCIYLRVDEVKFMQIITNLLSNAIKFTPDEGVITTRIEEQPSHVLISVADNGIGIPKRYQDRVFDRFTRAKRPGLRGEEAHGLGLSIVKALVEMHGGRIWLESEENQGTTFFIQLPKQYEYKRQE